VRSRMTTPARLSIDNVWWLAGMAGASVWNYAVSAIFTWKRH
jgi:hypothetical protein